jgi:hypothetical protein
MTWSTRRTSRRAERLAEEKGSVISALGLYVTSMEPDGTTGDLDGASFGASASRPDLPRVSGARTHPGDVPGGRGVGSRDKCDLLRFSSRPYTPGG